jgi:anti-sigma regulatory factor (Ser/Thr protein kinase)
MDKVFTSYHVEERSFVSYIKREIHIEVARAGFNDTQVGQIDIIVSELASNIIKHAGSGEVLYRITNTGEADAVFEIICIDKGPGMTDTARMMKDGMSTTGTLGQGMGAIERLSSFSQVYSLPKWGTIIYSRVCVNERKYVRKNTPDLEVRGLCVSKPREVACGDGYRVKRTDTEISIFFGDGLGHGEHARAAIDVAGSFFLACQENDPVEIIRQMHEKVRKTRGLVTSIAVFDKRSGQWRICGVGNIQVRMYSGIQYKTYMSYNGAVGLNIPGSLKDSVFPIENNQHLMMCSDGLKSRWDINAYPAIFKYDNTILAAALYRDYTRRTDDSSILIAKVS